MKTYKQRFIEACKQIADEYESKEGHRISVEACPVCNIYFKFTKRHNSPSIERCAACPIAYSNKKNKKEFICIDNLTYPNSAAFQSTAEIRSPIRAKFYRKVAKAAEFLPTKEFQPSMTKRKNSQLKSVIRTIDEVVNVWQKYRHNH